MQNDPSEQSPRDDTARRSAAPASSGRPADARRIVVPRRGPVLVDGPVEVELEDGTVASSDRFRVALCTCRLSERYPWCDTSHRRRR
ncbi:CDGSH iron-sulfur domain-containing protein [Streptomyces chilikensis]|uniref:CDGSH iron-sulfur domain-containing protein n=1 Tax=Streptomyces chilikensis TaxID=1194079 RepID=UPI003F4D03E0